MVFLETFRAVRPVLTVVLNLGKPGRGVGTNPVDESKQVVCRPLFSDLSVRYAQHVDRIPPDGSARRGNPEEVTLRRCLDDRAHDPDIPSRDKVLLDVTQVRKG